MSYLFNPPLCFLTAAEQIKLQVCSVYIPRLQQTFFSLFWSMFGQFSISDIAINHPKRNGGKYRAMMFFFFCSYIYI